MGLLDWITGNSGDAAVNTDTPDTGAAPSQFTEQSAQIKQRAADARASFASLVGQRYAPDEAKAAMGVYDTLVQNGANPTTLFESVMKTGAQPATGELDPAFIDKNPELESFRGQKLTQSAINDIIGSVATSKLRNPREQPYQVDRSQLPDWQRNLPDNAISEIAVRQYEHQQKLADEQAQQTSAWPRLKGKSLQIMNNDAFKRSGLRTGDTVCVQIP